MLLLCLPVVVEAVPVVRVVCDVVSPVFVSVVDFVPPPTTIVPDCDCDGDDVDVRVDDEPEVGLDA